MAHLFQHRIQLLQTLAHLQREVDETNLLIAQLNDQETSARQRRRRRRVWVREWLIRRPLLGQYERLMQELVTEDTASFKNFVRMEPAMFRELLERVGPRITKEDTWSRKALEPGLKLAITLRHLATGDSYHSLMYGFRVAHNTISAVIKNVCEAIIAEYAEEIMPFPSSPQEWKNIAELFSSRWQFHHTVGALDGKHIAIRCPKAGGSLYYNYKGFHSIVLMALVDADYKFIWVGVGANGSLSDAIVFGDSELKQSLEDETIQLPEPEPLPRDDRPMPYFIVGDDAFSLRTWMMKPFSRRGLSDQERIFNYRLSRARRIVENAFGILANRFGCLLTTLQQHPSTVESIVIACTILHNLMRLRYPTLQNVLLDQEDEDHNIMPGAWRQGRNLGDMDIVVRGNRTTAVAKEQRQYLMEYYNSDIGSVPWQGNMI